MKIHPTAIVAKEAQIAPGVEIGPYSIIGPDVKVGNGTRILNHVVIDGRTTLGQRCVIYSGVSLGTSPQVKNFSPIESFLSIGDDNILREYVTINVSMKPGGATLIGNRNYLMINTHIAHDCQLGDDITIANSTALGGHVTVENGAVISGMCGVHQYVRIGRLSMLGGFSKAVMDVLPFSISDGRPAKFYGLNSIGLRRAGYSSKNALSIKKALKVLSSPGVKTAAISKLKKQFAGDPNVEHLIRFAETSKRGLSRGSGEKPDA